MKHLFNYQILFVARDIQLPQSQSTQQLVESQQHMKECYT